MRPLLYALAMAGALGLGTALAAVDPTRLPLGDGKYTSAAPKRGWIYACGPRAGGGGAQAAGPWITGSTWNVREKISVVIE